MPEFSTQQRLVLSYLLEAKQNKEIAERLGIKDGTVETHLTRIYRKFGVRDRVGAIMAYYGHIATQYQSAPKRKANNANA